MTRHLQSLLTNWTEKRGLTISPADEAGRSFLVFDGQFEVAFSQLGTRIFLETDLATLPEKQQDAEALLETLLTLELAGSREDRAVLSVHEDKKTLTMFQVLWADRTTPLSFDAALSSFLNAVAFMTGHIEQGTHREIEAVPTSSQLFI